ncbi:MAG TPA: aminomethyl-transferring glycine dehydrogenase subunit GcvPA [Candidatus Omnitrophota bacterium]|nr:aminomethyl-transferring glycine dehydrogenase subunit GcvPA [Candidatus Omnitrophota bacterium]
MPYLSLTDEDKKTLLQKIGVNSVEDLLKDIPVSLRNPKVSLPAGLSEPEVQALLTKLGQKNTTTKDFLSFLGAGSYEHFIPAAELEIVGRQEFLTAYTPYQPEASQGTLQAIYEYQSLMTELTGLDVSNASHYDGATALAESALVALKHTNRSKILVARSVHPHYRETIRTYLTGTPYMVEEFGFEVSGKLDKTDLLAKLNMDIAGVIFQSPNFFGIIEDLEGLSETIHANGSLMILTANPLSLGIFRTPGEWGADIAAGEGQPLGLSMEFGGPFLGYFVVSQALMRRIPGRLAGLTEDADGKRAFCLTLQAREQHIRRERAGSNICSNQALCALAACAYMTLLGKKGIREIAEINFDRAQYLRSKIAKLKNFEVDVNLPIFNEFRVFSKKPFADVEKKMKEQQIFAGVSLETFYPELKNQFLVCATETKSKEGLDRFVEVLARC